MSSKAQLLTEGSVGGSIVRFAMPIFLGNLFQQLYNTVDSLVLGNFVGRDALAAVSSSGSLIFLLVGFFGGMFSGAGVVIARSFGAGDHTRMRRAIHTAVSLGLIAGAVITLAGTLAAPQILRLMQTPTDVFADACSYVRIYFAGIMSVVLYNTANGIFQAVGNSRQPLYFLIISSMLNVILDLIFVLIFQMGVSGAALATVISQSFSVLLAFTKLIRGDALIRLRLRELKIDGEILREMLRLGLPSGLQNSVIALANMVVQSNINAFDAVAVAGSGAYSKIEGFVFIPITSFALSMTTFIGQNLGAKNYDRAKRGARFGIITTAVIAELIGVFVFFMAPTFLSFFVDDAQSIQFGTMHAKTTSLFFVLLALSHSLAGIFRGAGRSIVPMAVMLGCWCVIRVSYITIAMQIVNDIRAVYWAYPLTWLLSAVIFVIVYFKSDWLHAYERRAHSVNKE